MMNQEKIQELVSRSQQDDKRAFALLVSEFQPLVFRPVSYTHLTLPTILLV